MRAPCENILTRFILRARGFTPYQPQKGLKGFYKSRANAAARARRARVGQIEQTIISARVVPTAIIDRAAIEERRIPKVSS